MYFEFYNEVLLEFTKLWPPVGSIQGINTVDVESTGHYPVLMYTFYQDVLESFAVENYDPYARYKTQEERHLLIPESYCRWAGVYMVRAEITSEKKLVCNMPARFLFCQTNNTDIDLEELQKAKFGSVQIPENDCFRASFFDLEISFAGNPTKWIPVSNLKFSQHELVSYKQDFQLTTDPIYGFGQITLKAWGTNFAPKYWSGTGELDTIAGGNSLPQCYWNHGSKLTTATVYNDTYLECPVPRLDDVVGSSSYTLPHDINVDITLDMGETRSYFSVIYKYINYFDIVALSPDRGMWKGGTPVEVFGSNFIKSPKLFCKFGPVAVPAVFYSDILMSCVAPALPQPAGGFHTYQFYYSVDGQYYAPAMSVVDGSPITYTATEEPILSSLAPDIGPHQGDVKVHIFGNYFANVEYLSCKFGVFVTPGVFVSTTEMTCFAPPCKDAKGLAVGERDVGKWEACFGTVGVQITLNLEEFYGAGIFEYTNRQQVRDVQPWGTSYNIGTLQVVISGTHFTSEMSCKFFPRLGQALPSVRATDIVVDADGNSDMNCVVTSLPEEYRRDPDLGTIYDTVTGYVEISANDQDYTSDRMPFVWYRPSVVLGVMPRSVFMSVPPQGYFIVKGWAGSGR